MTKRDFGGDDPLLKRLKVLAVASPDLEEAAQVYAVILPLLRDADLPVAPLSMTADQARAAMAAGRPLLDDVDLEIDIAEVRGFMTDLSCALERKGQMKGPIASAAGLVRRALQEDRLDVAGLMSHVAAGEEDSVRSVARGLGLEPGLLWMIAQNALKPVLQSCCRLLAPLVDGVPWHRGRCFICGADAALGELRGNHRAKHLRCRQCGADWQVRRLQCPWCGNEDHRALGLLYPDGRAETSRLEVCEACKGYSKVITTFEPTPAEMLPVEDLATLYLDYIAAERGYKRAPSRRGSAER